MAVVELFESIVPHSRGFLSGATELLKDHTIKLNW
jgi:hypothetical protein